MSDMIDDIFKKNFLNLTLDEDFPSSQARNKSRLNRSASFFSPPSPPAAPCHSLSSGDINNEDNGPIWSNIWSQAPISKPKQPPFRPDRSMSLTDSSSSLLSTLGQLKSLEGFPSGPSTTVAPPPGFAPSANLQAQMQPMLASNRYKTELCRGFQETGSCKYGNKCQFAHGEAELRGLYRHPKYKTEACRTFYNFGYCPYGSRCHFIHEEKIGGSQAKFQRQVVTTANSIQNPRHQLRQSVSFAGFLHSRSSPPPAFPNSFNDPNLVFSRAPSVSPPPADLLSPVFNDSIPRDTAFQFGPQLTRASTGDIHNIPLIVEPKASRCVCGHGNNLLSDRGFPTREDLLPAPSALGKAAGLQRFSSEDSLEDSYSSSSGGSSGSESPTFDVSNTKRLNVFERLSLSE
ncbi:mRNA decay activator protein ZFP36 [Boleophthalmus pectinirostris]|uniref:mRNA decay activator protein ZFP36 n=1 Tax=Boleophthalmus pectinirostris TaxID=150288 RepID=UPI00242E56CC|nr:mRNA decay activator protein ZFP36 [Boleophthalmus pectinirostris]